MTEFKFPNRWGGNYVLLNHKTQELRYSLSRTFFKATLPILYTICLKETSNEILANAYDNNPEKWFHDYIDRATAEIDRKLKIIYN